MKRRTILRQSAVALAVAAFWTGTAAAQTVLKFSHTDQPGGARQKAAELFAQKVEQYTQGALQGPDLSGGTTRERSEGR